MTSVNIVANNPNIIDGFDHVETERKKAPTESFIRQRIHERHIDSFFWTDVQAPRKRTSWLAAAGSVLGVMTPLLIMSRKQSQGLKLSLFKRLGKAINIHYTLKEILATGLGGVAGGLLGSLADRKERNKLNKFEEATFQTMNIAFPAIFVDSAIKFCKKTKGLNNNFMKIVSAGLGIATGAGLAVKISNKLDDKFFDKYNHDPERKFKKKDFIVHIDDVLGTLVLAKFPLADKLHIEKILPLIYSWSGYHVGEA